MPPVSEGKKARFSVLFHTELHFVLVLRGQRGHKVPFAGITYIHLQLAVGFLIAACLWPFGFTRSETACQNDGGNRERNQRPRQDFSSHSASPSSFVRLKNTLFISLL